MAKTQREAIYEEVIRAMQDAEEMSGPEGPEYVKLMTDIAKECIQRVSNFSEWNKPEKPVILSFEDFQKTGHNVRFSEIPELNGSDSPSEFGRIYAGNCVINLMDDGSVWHLVICNEEYTNTNLSELERILYDDWYIHEAQ